MNTSRRNKMTDEQKQKYALFIQARDKIRHSNKWIPTKDVICTVDVTGLNHPLFEANYAYLHYQEMFKQWLAVEPEYRKTERMSMIRGDYEKQDTWKGEK
jgi:hypothetical protein